MNRTLLQAGLAAAFMTAAALPAHAVVVGPIFSTGTPSGGVVQSDAIDASDWVAESFTLQSAATINSIQAYVLSAADSLDAGQTFTVALYGSKPAGGALVPNLNWNANNQGQLGQFTATYTSNGGWIGQSNLGWSLAAGTYFVAIEIGSADGASNLVLPTGVTNAPANVAFYTGGQAYTADSTPAADAFGLTITPLVSAVPEPSAAALLLAGLAFAGAVARRRVR